MKQNQRRTFKARIGGIDPSEKDFLVWQSRNYMRILLLSIEAEPEWIDYLHEQGVDTSGYPSEDRYIPELGITQHRVFFPDALKSQFRQWLREEYFPRKLGGPDRSDA